MLVALLLVAASGLQNLILAIGQQVSKLIYVGVLVCLLACILVTHVWLRTGATAAWPKALLRAIEYVGNVGLSEPEAERTRAVALPEEEKPKSFTAGAGQ